MYKKYNFKPEILSSPRRSSSEGGSAFSGLAEKLLPFLLIATTFVWLWR